ncbi:hypothetical protein FRC08_011035 [Ceratobasidium sp. 394]|nr:hypothetical protein FRC08_011035 [Ceratobasidium sp. 394]
MHISGLVLTLLNLFRLVATRTGERALGDPGVELWRNGRTVGLKLIELWPDNRLCRFLALRGINVDGATDGAHELSHSELVSLVYDSLSAPIITSPVSLRLASFSSHQCADLTVDQLVHWAAHHSGTRVNSHGANVFDAPPTEVRSRAKRVAGVELCERMYRERVLGVVTLPSRDASEFGSGLGSEQEERLDVDQQRLFAAQIAQAEASPHVFEPKTNPALDRAAKHSIYDLRDLLNVFGVPWTEQDSHAYLTEVAKVHTALWTGNIV